MITALPRIAIAMHDFDEALALFGDVFGLPMLDLSPETVPDLGAHVGMCMPPDGSMIELMAPATPDAPLSQALSKFLDRRGEGLYALMLEAPDPNAEAEELAGRGLEVLPLMPGAGGRDLHPRSTHGVLIRVYPDGSVKNPGETGSAPHLSGIVRATLATHDVHQATKTYGFGLGLDVSAVEVDDERGVAHATVNAPKGGVIELVSPIDPGRPFAADIDHFLANGEGLWALTLSAADPEGAAAHLLANGVLQDTRCSHPRAFSVYGTRILIDA